MVILNFMSLVTNHFLRPHVSVWIILKYFASHFSCSFRHLITGSGAVHTFLWPHCVVKNPSPLLLTTVFIRTQEQVQAASHSLFFHIHLLSHYWAILSLCIICFCDLILAILIHSAFKQTIWRGSSPVWLQLYFYLCR